jgi:hypothetical protein
MALDTVRATRYVAPLREGGSLPGLAEADDDGLYVVKFRGAGQGRKALVAEVLCAGIARALGLQVPTLVLVELDAQFGAAEPDPDIQDLLRASHGINLGVDYLPGCMTWSPGLLAIDPDVAAAVVWFDALVTNVDRTPRNPNMLVWHKNLYLIDHGAALYFAHTWKDWETAASKPFPAIKDHVLLPHAGSIAAADERIAPLVTRQLLADVLANVPADWLAAEPVPPDGVTYADFLLGRLEGPRTWVQEADRART